MHTAPPDYTQRYMAALTHGISYRHPMVRAAAARAAVYMEWPELGPVLRSVARDDADERVRREAEQVLAAYEGVGVEEPR